MIYYEMFQDDQDKMMIFFKRCFFSNSLGFVLKSEIHISEEYVKIGTIIELYSFSRKFGERVKSNGSLRFKAK